jgi:AAA family ATP:ADP antiporter
VVFLILFTKLSNVFSKEKLFYIIVIPFLVFFLGFGWILYPNSTSLHLDPHTIAQLKTAYPNFQWFFPMFGNWTFSLFYILSEMWGTVVLSLLFWSFANEVTSISEAKRFYFMFGFFGQIGLILINPAFTLANFLSRDAGQATFEGTLKVLSIFQVTTGLIVLGCYWFLRNRVLTNPAFNKIVEEPQKTKKKKPKLSIKESFKYILSSKYIGFIAILVCSYGICINLIEVTWKSMVKMAYPTTLEYNTFMGKFSTMTGIATMFMTLVGSFILRKTNWKIAASITPIVVAITGGFFFFFVLFKETLEPVLVGLLGVTPLMFSVLLGSVQNIFSKSAKYTLFDGTKEMTYIPLDEELKLKGKAAVDVVGGRLGKSGGALFQNLLLIFTGGNQQSIASFIAGAFALFVGAWIWAVLGLSKLFEEKMSEQEKTTSRSAKTAKA